MKQRQKTHLYSGGGRRLNHSGLSGGGQTDSLRSTRSLQTTQRETGHIIIQHQKQKNEQEQFKVHKKTQRTDQTVRNIKMISFITFQYFDSNGSCCLCFL